MDAQKYVAVEPTAAERTVFQSDLPVAEKLERARVELLDLSARNRLLSMPRGSKAARSIDIVDESSAEIFRLLVREGKTFSFVAGRGAEEEEAQPAAQGGTADDPAVTAAARALTSPSVRTDDPAELTAAAARRVDTKLQTRLSSKGLQNRLLELYLDARTLEEEQGVNVLFLTLGALKWIDPNNKENVRYAPLLLVPVQLDRGNIGEKFTLKARQEDFASNLSLEAFLDRGHALRMPSFEASDSFSLSGYIDEMKTCIATKNGWELIPDDMSIGFFSFAKFLMYRDLDPEVWPADSRISDRALIRSLLAEGFAGDSDTTHGEDVNIDEIIPPAEMLHILDCDSSQALAIDAVRKGKDLIIQGPPGTGKSQTIANVIAAAVKDGKSVLFVAEKMAALEVVKRRLDDRGVGDACLELHSNKANKRAVLDELRRTWELGAPKTPQVGTLFARLTEARDSLNAHAVRMHVEDHASGLTPFQVIGQLVRLRSQGEPANDIVLTDPQCWGRDGFNERLDLLADLAERITETGPPAAHAWVGVGLSFLSPMDVERLVNRINTFFRSFVEQRARGAAIAARVEAPAAERLEDIGAIEKLLQRVAKAPVLASHAMASDVWQDVVAINQLLQQGRRYALAVERLDGKLKPDAWAARRADLVNGLSLVPPSFTADHLAQLKRIADELPRVLSSAASLSSLLGRAAAAEYGEFAALIQIGERVAAAPPASPETFAADLWDGGVERAGELAQAVSELVQARAEIGGEVSDEAWAIDLTAARNILAAKGGSVFRHLSSEWRKANRTVASAISNAAMPLSRKLEILDTLAKGRRAQARIESEDAFGTSAFGLDWRGGRSDPAPLHALVEWMRSLRGLGAEPRLIASKSPHKGEIAARAKQLSELTTNLEPLLLGIWSDVGALPAFSAVATAERADLSSLLELATAVSEANAGVQGVIAASTETVGDMLCILAELDAGQRARDAVMEGAQLGRSAFDDAWDDERSDWDRLSVATEWIAQNQDIRALAGRVPERDQLIPAQQSLAEIRHEMLKGLDVLVKDLELDCLAAFGGPVLQAPLENIERRLRRWNDEHEQLSRWVNYCDRSRRAVEKGCGDVVTRLADGRLGPQTVLSAMEMAYFEAMLGRMVKAEPALGRFDGSAHSRLVKEFAALDRERIAVASAEVVQAHYRDVPPRAGGALGPLGVLRGEIQKKKGHMPIRKLVERAGPALRALKPVFMMSPLSVAQFLVPGAMEFDLLVMDEASQIQPVDALGAIARAKQMVVVGDPKQLPPTAFFSKMTSSDEDDDEDVTQVSDIESILGLCSARGLPTRMLRWHYRSRHQSLIAVSNRQFYENKLFIVPSPYTADGGRGLLFHHVHDGLFDAGTKRINVIEARTVAQAIVSHARNHPKLSLGVAAFSAAQRKAIIDELELLRRELPDDVEDFFRGHRSEPFFVKNLENVQGDERDVIFISVGYGRSVPNGRVPMRFGPLGQQGGERRLNVLISRAKQRCDVFASMTDEDIDPDYAASRKGVYAFRLFLQYARTGRLAMADVTGKDHDSVFEEQVAAALRAEGYEVQAQIGVAGFFIDLAVVDAERPGRFLLGIECDGAAYHSARSARERDRLRQSLLEEHGWNIHRIWSTDWFQRPAEQLELLRRRIAAAQAEFDERKDDRTLTEQLDVEAPYVEREETTAPTELTTFSPYREASLLRPAHVTAELHEAPQGILTQLVVEAVQVEGPVHRDMVTTRLREAWGLKRAGGRIEDAVSRSIDIGIRTGRLELSNGFLNVPGSAAIPRDRSAVTTIALRRADMLPPVEMEAAIIQLVTRSFGATREQVIQAASRGFGIKNTSSQVRLVLEQAVDGVVSSGKLKEIAGVLTPA